MKAPWEAVWPGWICEKRIGQGSSGTVYKASKGTGEQAERAAVKVIQIPTSDAEIDALRSDGLTEEETRQYFDTVVEDLLSEVRIISEIKDYSHIVRVDDYAILPRADGIGATLFIRMELLMPLSLYLADKTLSEKEVIWLGSDIAEALALCHREGILHRDVKPENIFVDDEGRFKLGDFGIARRLEMTATHMTRVGTPFYAAPEVSFSMQYDRRADLYSLGLVLYRFLNHNRLPFMEDKRYLTQMDRMRALQLRLAGEALPEPAEASERTAKVILKACAFKPEDRYQSAEEFRAALLEEKTKKSWKKRGVAVAAAMLLLAAGIGILASPGRRNAALSQVGSSQSAENILTSDSAAISVTTEEGAVPVSKETSSEATAAAVTVRRHTHQVEDWVVEKEPGCSEVGRKTGVCVTCGESVTRNIPTVDHDFLLVAEGDGCNDYWKDQRCRFCGLEEHTVEVRKHAFSADTGRCEYCHINQCNYELSGDGAYYICTGYNSDALQSNDTTRIKSQVHGGGNTLLYTMAPTALIPAVYDGIPVKEIGDAAFAQGEIPVTAYTGRGGWTVPEFLLDKEITKTSFIRNQGAVIPEGIEVIGAYAFYNDMMIDIDIKVNIPSSVRHIKYGAFEGVSPDVMKDFRLPEVLEILEPDSLDYYPPRSSLVGFRYNVSENPYFLEELTIPAGLKNCWYFLGYRQMFNDPWPKIGKLTIHTAAFLEQDTGYYYTDEIILGEEVGGYEVIDGALIEKSTGTLIKLPEGGSIPGGGVVRHIKKGAIYLHSDGDPFTEIHVPEGVETMESMAIVPGTNERNREGLIIHLPKSLKEIGQQFMYGDKITVYYAGTINDFMGLANHAVTSNITDTITIHCSDGTIEPVAP